MLSMQDKNTNRKHFEIIFSFSFPENSWHFMQIVSQIDKTRKLSLICHLLICPETVKQRLTCDAYRRVIVTIYQFSRYIVPHKALFSTKKVLIFSLYLHENICCGTYNMCFFFLWRNKNLAKGQWSLTWVLIPTFIFKLQFFLNKSFASGAFLPVC